MGSDARLTRVGYEHLKDWGDGKPHGIFLLGAEAATAASACHELLEQSCRRSGPIWQLPEPDDKTWFRFYRSRRALRRGLCEALGLSAAEAKVVGGLFAQLAWCSHADKAVVRQQVDEELRGVDFMELMRSVADFQREFLQAMDELEHHDDPLTQRKILNHPAMVFFLQVAAPIYLRYGEWPQTLLMRATASNGPDLVALDWLVRNDRRARRHPAISRAISAAPSTTAQLYRAAIKRAEKGRPRKVNRSTLETRICGLISEVGLRMGMQIEAREIRKLFDLQARHETDNLRNFHLHHYSRTFTREVNRARKHWLRSMPTMQAYESLKCVRTLLDQAFYHVGHDTARTFSN